MLLRRTALAAAVLAAVACEPSVPHNTNPTQIDYAEFDPTNVPADLPLPNDLALQPSAIGTQQGAAQELLQAFAAQGGFPNDQEVPITINFVHETIDPDTGALTRSAPQLDLSTINSSTVVLTNLGTAEAFDPPVAADYTTVGDHGQLVLHRSLHPIDASDPTSTKTRRLDSGGVYVVAVRGGANGVKTTSGGPIYAQPTMFLLVASGASSFLDPQNQLLLPGSTAAARAAAAQQLEQLRVAYQLPFGLVDAHFPHSEIAVLTAFHVAPAGTHIETDPGAGLMPLPSDFLLDASHHLVSPLNSVGGPFGPLGPGLGTLDGFSTTAMILSQTSAPVVASTINSGSAFLYELSATGATRLAEVGELVHGIGPARFVAEPPAITVTPPGSTVKVSTVVGLQPAVPVPVSTQLVASGILPLPALKEATEYAVILTDGIKDLNGAPLRRSTLAKLLLFKNALADSSGHSLVPGVTDAQAPGLEQMRQVLAGVLLKLKADAGVDAAHVVMAYTFRTQSITSAAVQLAALPYSSKLAPADTALPPTGVTQSFCAACAKTVNSVYDRYGIDVSIPRGNVGTVVESEITTLNNLAPLSGAFNDPTVVPVTREPIPVIISLPKFPLPGGCLPTATSICPVPLVIFRHGVFSSRAAMLTVADRFAAKGMAVAAIDANKHGARTFCSADNQCLTGHACVHDAALSHQGDPAGATPGKCEGGTPANGGNLFNLPVLCPKVDAGGGHFVPNCTYAEGTPVNPGTPAASGNFLLGANLFRTRDTLRQDLIDQSQLIKVLGVDPTPFLGPAPAATNDIVVQIAAQGMYLDPTRIYYVGQSLGGIQGVSNVATNPRINKALLNVTGQTIADVFSNSPSLSGSLNALLASIGITPGTAAYLQFIQTAKWILDPADPANFSEHLIKSPLPNLLGPGPLGGNPDGSVPQAAKKILGQIAFCDATVPNPFNYLTYEDIGLGPDTGSSTVGTVTFFSTDPNASSVAACATPATPPPGTVPHAFLTDWGFYGNNTAQDPVVAGLTQKAQDDAANFFLNDTHPPLIEKP